MFGWFFIFVVSALIFGSIRFSSKFYKLGFPTFVSEGLIFYPCCACPDFPVIFQRPRFSNDFFHVLNLHPCLAASVFQRSFTWSDFGPDFSEGLIFYRFFACADFHVFVHRPWFPKDLLHVLNLLRFLATSCFWRNLTCPDFGQDFCESLIFCIFCMCRCSNGFQTPMIFNWFFTCVEFVSMFGNVTSSRKSYLCYLRTWMFWGLDFL